MSTVTLQKQIRSMRAEELLDHLEWMGGIADHTGTLQQHINLVCTQYQQVTGQALTAETQGLSCLQAALLLAVGRGAKIAAA